VSSERGFTLVEMLVAISLSLVVMLGIFALVEVTNRGSARIASRVEADQLARPVMQRLVDELHSTCVGPNTTPVLAGSGDSSLVFLQQTGSAVSPIPDKHVVTLAGGALSESVYPATGGTAPSWIFATTASSTRQLLTRVGAASSGSPPASLPLFQYFAYQGGQLSTTPLPTPLSTADAVRTSEITVSFSVSPAHTPVFDPHASVSVSDSATLRLAPPAEDTSQANPPCA
jgi:prepilin-type N-terminal cleavage/methylation domain-containing protein